MPTSEWTVPLIGHGNGPTARGCSGCCRSAEHLDVAAVGAFTADRCGSIGDRLARLISGTPQVLRIDCRAVTALDPEVAQLFTDAATTLANRGGALALVDMPAPLRAMV